MWKSEKCKSKANFSAAQRRSDRESNTNFEIFWPLIRGQQLEWRQPLWLMSVPAEHSKRFVPTARINNSHIPQSLTVNSLCAPADKRRSVWSWSVYWMSRKCCLSASERYCPTPIMLLRQMPNGLSATARKMTERPADAIIGHGIRQSRKRRQSGWTAQARNGLIWHAIVLILTLSTMGKLTHCLIYCYFL